MRLSFSCPLGAVLPAFLIFISPAFSASYVAEGVTYGDEMGSTRFFDSGKGTYWDSYITSSGELMQPLPGVIELANKEKSYDFLGTRLNGYISTPYTAGSLPGYSPEYERNGNSVSVSSETWQSLSTVSTVLGKLTADGDMCWAYAASNALQYWSSYYGVFSGNAASMPYGYTYRDGKEHAVTLGGTQSLQISMELYDAFRNQGGGAYNAFSWWFSGTQTKPYGQGDEQFRYTGTLSSILVDSEKSYDGYFADYFPKGGADTLASQPSTNIAEVTTVKQISDTAYQVSNKVHSNAELADKVARSLGFERQPDGSFKQVDKGLLAVVDIRSSNHASGHAITAHGFEVDENGNVAILVSNSDDGQYSLFKLYLKLEDDFWFGYTDAACTEKWVYSGKTWYIQNFEYINTPAELRAMRAVYESNALVWKGSDGNEHWQNNAESAIADALPTGVSNWHVEVSDGENGVITGTHEGYYDSYFGNGRDVLFDDSAQNSTVVLDENITAGRMEVANSVKNYEFSGAHKLAVASLSKSGAAHATFSGVELTAAQTVDISGAGALKLRSGASLSLAEAFHLRQKSDSAEASLSHATLGVTETGGYLHGVSAQECALLSNVAVDVAAGCVLDMKDALLTEGTTISGGEGSQLTVTHVTMELGDLRQVSSTLATGSLLQQAGGGVSLTYGEGDTILALESSALQGLVISGDSLTLDFSALMKSRSLLSGYDVVSLTFDNVLFSGLDTLEVAGLDGTDELRAFYSTQELAAGGGQVATLYFSSAWATVPEPATATLSLLALAFLSARRRR